jgi:beta-galactosidase
MTIGVCYFPEHWPRERWTTDAARMADAGIDVVRLAEFSWAVLEPRRNEFDFEWLDEAVDVLASEGLDVVLCTPTATPPKWLVDERPGILQADPDGTPRAFGSRRFTCFNSPAYREATRRVVSRMAAHYADHPAVVGWQTDNEFGCHGTVRCYCDDCADAFSAWLRERYDTIDDLNESWGTTFWSQRYPSFEAVDPPRPTPAEHHPSHLLEYARFASESVVDYNRLHAELLREHGRDRDDEWFVAHNFMGDFETLDAHAVSEDLDLVTWDSYPTGFVQDRRATAPTMDELRAGDPDQVGVNHDLYRGTNDAPFWVMEQQPGDVNWPPTCPQPGEGAMRLWAHHAVAHGADAVLYFRWRRCRQGQEQYHAGLRKQDGSSDRGYADATRAAEELSALAGGDTPHVDAPVALLHDYEDWWALSAQPHATAYDYWEHLRTYYRALRERGVQVDVVHPETDLSGYAVAVAPSLHLADERLAAHLTTFVEDGGELLLGARSGAKDPYNQLHSELAPGPLAALAGLRVDQHESYPEGIERTVALADGTEGTGGTAETDEADGGRQRSYRVWSEWLDLDAAAPLATHTDDLAGGTPAVARNEVGDGSVVYSGVWPGADLAADLVDGVLSRAGVSTTPRLPSGVRVNRRGDLTWVTNFTSDSYRLDGFDDDAVVLGAATLGAFDACAVRIPLETLTVEAASDG